MAKTTGLGLLELATVFDNLKPDVVVTVADRYETLATAVAAAYMNIPVAHVQGGEVTGSIDEKVRHAVTKLADLHLVSTAARRRARHPHGRGPGDGLRDRLSVDRPGRRDARGARRSTSTRSRIRRRRRAARPVERLRRRDAASGHDRVRAGAAAGRPRRCTRCGTLGLPTLWFWPNVDAGVRRHVERHPRRSARRERPDNIHFFKNMAPDGFPPAALQQPLPGRQLQRRDPRVLVPRRARS